MKRILLRARFAVQVAPASKGAVFGKSVEKSTQLTQSREESQGEVFDLLCSRGVLCAFA